MLKADRIIALDIGASKLVMAEFSTMKAGGLELSNYAVVPLGVDPDSDADLPAHMVHSLRQVLREKNIRPGRVLISVSGQMVFPRNVKLPPVPKDKIPQIVRYEAQQNVPFSIDEVVWDYQLIGDQQGELSVLLVAVKTADIQKLTDCVEAAGLDPEIVDVSPLALYNAVRYNYPELDGCTMVLDIGARSTNVVFVEGNRIFTRSIPVAGLAVTRELMKEFNLSFEDAEQLKFSHAFVGFGGVYDDGDTGVAQRVSRIARGVMTRLHAEVVRTINFYRSQQGGGQPSLVLLSGGSSVIAHTNTFLKDKLKVEVDYLNPFRNVTVSNRISAEDIGRDVQVLGEVVGLALRRTLTCPIEINLLPPDLAARRRFSRRLPFFAAAAVGLALVMLVWWAYFQRMRDITVDRLINVNARVAQLAERDRQLNEIQKEELSLQEKTKGLAGLIGQRSLWIEILQDLQSLMPEGMWLVSMQPHPETIEGREVTFLEISGLAFSDKVSHESVTKFLSSLKTARHFSDRVDIKRSRPVPGNEYINEFVVDVALK